MLLISRGQRQDDQRQGGQQGSVEEGSLAGSEVSQDDEDDTFSVVTLKTLSERTHISGTWGKKSAKVRTRESISNISPFLLAFNTHFRAPCISKLC